MTTLQLVFTSICILKRYHGRHKLSCTAVPKVGAAMGIGWDGVRIERMDECGVMWVGRKSNKERDRRGKKCIGTSKSETWGDGPKNEVS